MDPRNGNATSGQVRSLVHDMAGEVTALLNLIELALVDKDEFIEVPVSVMDLEVMSHNATGLLDHLRALQKLLKDNEAKSINNMLIGQEDFSEPDSQM